MSASDELAKTETQLAHVYAHVTSGDADQVNRLAAALDATATDLRTIAADLGVEGTSADAAGDAFDRVIKEMRGRADEFTAAALVASKAYDSVMRARAAYQALPSGSIDAGLRAAIVVGGKTVAGPVGELAGTAAVGFLNSLASQSREEEAEKALATLTSEMVISSDRLPDVGVPRDIPGATETIDIDSLFGTSSGPGEPGPYPGPRTPGTVIPGGPGSGGGGGSTPTVPPVVVADPDGPKPPGGGGEDNPNTDNPTDNPGTDDKDPGDGGSADGDTTGDDGDDGSTVKNPTGGGGVGGTGGGTGGGGAGGLLGGGLAIGGAAAGAIGLGRGLGLGAGGLGGGAAGMGGIGMAGGAGGAGGAAGGRGAGLAGSRTGGMAAAGTSTTGGAAGSRGAGMVGGGGTGGGGAGGASKKRRRGGAGYLGPDIDIEDDAEVVDLGAGARAGGRGSGTVAAEVMDDIDDETW